MINPDMYFYKIGEEHSVCADKHDSLYKAIIKSNEDTLSIYKEVLNMISLVDTELRGNRELDSIISIVYDKIKEEMDAMASADI